jgi:hypothetical protein
MKKLILALLLLVSTSFVSAQNIVNIKLTSLTSNNCQVTLYPAYQETSILSNVVFTLRWKATQNIVLGDPQSTSLITITKSGPVRINNGWKYQIYSGCGLISGIIPQSITLNISRSGIGKLTISNDSYLQQLSVNGEYYVSIGGQNVTGNILTTREFELEEEQSSSIIMYLDPLTRQFYVKKDGIYYDIVGRKVTIFNENELVIVRKRY